MTVSMSDIDGTVFDKTLTLRGGMVTIEYSVEIVNGDLETERRMSVRGADEDVDMWRYNESRGGFSFLTSVTVDGQEAPGVSVSKTGYERYSRVDSEYSEIVTAYEAVDDFDSLEFEGGRVKVVEQTLGCDDSHKECNTDRVEYYICEDGSVETERVHLH